ncbi:MAG: cohesin domain-containing protein [Bacteroidia bacterium]|nr:cohesin domain-containing protein [Bacteroidia bacterium]
MEMDNKYRKKIKIFAIAGFLLCIFPLSSEATGASLYLSPNAGTFYVGSTFDVSIFVNTGNNSINAVGTDLKFDPRKIQIANPTTGKSFISVWVAQPTYSNIEGRASFQGGVPSPGVNTSSGLISTITFRAIAPGETEVYFLESSKVLLNNGQGTNVLTSMGRGVYNLTIPPPEGPEIYSSTHPDQNKWYKNNNPTFSWAKEEGVTDYSYTINNDFGDVPDNISEGSHSSISYTALQDGIWYFHVKSKKGNVWGGTSHYVVQIDSSPPADFTVDFEPKLKSPVITSQEPIVYFITTDALSGIDHYELKVIGFNAPEKNEAGFFTEVSSPYKLPLLDTGEHEIVVRAFDVAGNWKDSSQKIEAIPTGKLFYFTKQGMSIWMFFFNWWQVILFLLMLVILILIISFLWWKKDRDLNEKIENLRRLRKEAEKTSQNF